MKENKNNEIQNGKLEQVAGGGPGDIEAIDTELKELQRLLKGERQAYVQAMKRIDTSPGADVTARMTLDNIAELEWQVCQKISQRQKLLEDFEDMR